MASGSTLLRWPILFILLPMPRSPNSRGPRSRRGWGEGRISQLPSGRWIVELSAGTDPTTGKRSRPSKTFDTKPEAVAWLAEQQAARGIGKGSHPANWTLAEWCEHWLRKVKTEREAATHRFYDQRVRVHIIPHIGSVKLINLTRIVVDEWRAKLASLTGDAAVSPGQQHLSAKTLRAACAAAVDAGVLPRNPVGAVRKPKGGGGKKKINPMTSEEARAFLYEARGTAFESLWWVALDTGARPGELAALLWDDVDLDRGEISITKSVGVDRVPKPPKTPAGNRVVPIAAKTVEKLRATPRRGANVWCVRVKPGEPARGLTVTAIWRKFNAIRKRAGISHRRAYDMRHTSATLLLAAGVSLRVVADRLGHEDPGITLRFYAGALPQDADAARKATGTIYG